MVIVKMILFCRRKKTLGGNLRLRVNVFESMRLQLIYLEFKNKG